MHASRRVVLLVDAFGLRRASISSFLKGWAAGEDLDIVDCGWPKPDMVGRDECVFVIQSLGGARVSAPDNATALLTLRGLYPGVPLAVLCDGDHCDDVTIAAECGVNGYLDGRLSAELMPYALSFVLRGGSYIPPSAVTGRARETGISLGRVLAAHHRPAPGRHRAVPLPPAFVGGLQDPRFQYYLPSYDTDSVPSVVPLEPETMPGSPHHGALVQADIPPVEEAIEAPIAPPATDGNGTGPMLAAKKVTAFGMTERQMAVLRGLCNGDPNKVIANRLGLTETTVKVHVREIMRKLGVSNRTQVALAVGELLPEPPAAASAPPGDALGPDESRAGQPVEDR